jgi:hypothetical protein
VDAMMQGVIALGVLPVGQCADGVTPPSVRNAGTFNRPKKYQNALKIPSNDLEFLERAAEISISEITSKRETGGTGRTLRR